MSSSMEILIQNVSFEWENLNFNMSCDSEFLVLELILQSCELNSFTYIPFGFSSVASLPLTTQQPSELAAMNEPDVGKSRHYYIQG